MKVSISSLSAVVLIILSAFSGLQQEQKLNIAAAANLKVALDSIIAVYKNQNPGVAVLAVYGSSGKLFEQISQDAPFDIFFSADMEYPNKLKERNLAGSEVKKYATGQLVIWSRKSDPNILKMNLLLDAGIKKISVANPVTAPYGEKAVECMKYYGLYDKVQDKLVYGENITQAAQFVTSGAADIVIVALSLALTPNMQKENGKFYVIPGESHKPLEQGCVILKHANANSQASGFFKFISSTTAIKILKHFGYN
jgi:molybdate transport system substrate-binding protein